MSSLPLFAPWLVFVSALWTMLPLLCPRQRRTGIVIAVAHLSVTPAITRPWTDGWYWDAGWWLMLVFGQGTLIALGRLVFELSPLGARRHGPAPAPREPEETVWPVSGPG